MRAFRLPPPIPAYAPGTFAAFTLQHRLPRVLADVRQALSERHRQDARWDALLTAVTRGSAIDPALFAPDTPYWRRRIAAVAGQPWSTQPFFDLEFLFYKAIDSIARALLPGLDVFASTRRAALAQSLPDVARTLQAVGTLSLQAAVSLSLAGNQADLSQLARPESASPTNLVVDERASLLSRLTDSHPRGDVHILADNAGSELCFDLLLASVLLELELGGVVVHVKGMPMFVSDAQAQDVEETIAAFEGLSRSSALVRAGQTLRCALEEGRLSIRSPADWAEPRHMDQLEPELLQALAAARIVVVKGDLNYRRFFGDRAWSPQTTVAEASLASDQCAFALRVIKSDCVVGVRHEDSDALFATDPEWRSNGRYSMIQRVDKGSTT